MREALHGIKIFSVRTIILRILSVQFFIMVKGWRYGKCWNKLLLNSLPAKKYVKISNVSTNTQLNEAVS